MRRPRRGIAFYVNGPAFGIAVLSFPAVLLGTAVGYVIAGAGAVATWPWWRPSGRVLDGVIVTRGLYLPRRRRVDLADVRSLELILAGGTETWDGAAVASGGVTVVTYSGERIPIVESASWSTSHAERWLGYLRRLQAETVAVGDRSGA